MSSQWRKPNASEAAKGFIAMLPRVYYCQVGDGILTIDFRGKCKENGLTYLQQEAWEGFSQTRLERRASYTDDLPSWWENYEKMKQIA